MTRLLVIDDDRALTGLLADYLAGEGFGVDAVHDAETGLGRLDAEPDAWALVVLDIMLPGVDGLEALRRLRTRHAVPVVMLTARGEELDRIVGLEVGADDYLPKPFNPRELVARIRAVLRRVERADAGPGGELVVGDLSLRPGERVAQCGGRVLALTSTEYDVLEVLMRHAGEVVLRSRLSELALGRRPAPYERAVDMHVSRLRRKLGPRADGGERIKTVRGRGWLLVVAEQPRDTA